MATEAHFTKIHQLECQKLIRAGQLTPSERVMLFNLLPFVLVGDYYPKAEDCPRGWARIVDETGQQMTITAIGKLCGVEPVTASRTLKRLEAKRIVKLERIPGGNSKGVLINGNYFSTT